MTIQTWVSTFINAPESSRKRMLDALYEGMSHFNATWKKPNLINENFKKPETVDDMLTNHQLKSKDKKVLDFMKWLDKETELVGVTPEIQYMKVKGPKEHLDVIWEHDFGSPAALHAAKDLPALIIAGPDIMFNDSMVKNIKSNAKRGKVFGITG